MLFVHGFCLTEADGTSPVEWLEPSWSSPLRVVSGPAATSFGGAYGGAILVEPGVQSWIGPSPDVLRDHWAFGRFAIAHQRASRRTRSGKRVWPMPKTQDSARGKATIVGRLNCLVVGKVTRPLTTPGLLSSTRHWDLPGSVDSLTAAETPEFAPGENTTPTFNGGVHCGGIMCTSHDVPALGTRSTVDVWALLRLTDKINPFGTSPFFNGYKEESGSGASLRIRQRWAAVKRPSWNLQAEWSAMATLDQGRFELWDDPNVGRFESAEYDLTCKGGRRNGPHLAMSHHKGWRLEASVAASARARTAEGTASDTTYSAPFNAAEWLPRVGISKTLGPKLSLFSQASTGYSDPTNFETLPFEDGANASATLMSERARSLELGLRRPGLECVLYHQNVQDPIVEQVDSLGISTFVNADAPLQMQGVETRAQWQGPRHALSVAATWQHHLLNDNGLPGSPPWMANLQWMWQPRGPQRGRRTP